MAEIPKAAVQIVRDALAVRGYLTTIDNVEAPKVAAALAREGWLHDPAEIAALRVVVEAARSAHRSTTPAELDDAVDDLCDAVDALDALDVLNGPKVS